MSRSLNLAAVIAWLAIGGLAPGAESLAPRAADPWAGYRFAPDALEEIDLGSDTEWTLSIDGGAPRPIKVTGGGWNSDQQSPPIASDGVKDCAAYERTIAIPAGAEGRVVKVLFGACNYGAEVFLDDRKVTEHNAPMTPFDADLTGLALPGKTHRLRVKAYTRYHFGRPPIVPVGFDFNKGLSSVKQYDGHTKYAYGLTGHVRLAVYPAVHIADVFVRPSVAERRLSYDVWMANATETTKKVVLRGALSSWDGRAWAYPALPDREVEIPARQTRKISVDDVPWTLGPESYWWPNIPFREDYRAVLHRLNLSLVEGGEPVHQRSRRFGFVEHREGPYYYTVNGVRFTSFGDSNSYGQVGEYDCWTETPCFQPRRDGVKGCPETWKRYQRIGFNSMRLSTSVPTAYMLETADEAGYMLVPEGGSWGNGICRFDKDNFSRQLQGTIRACRNHPCVARYSLANESLPADFASPKNRWRWLIDAALEVDPTRPLVFEVNNGQTGAVPGMKAGHAHQMEHYRPIVPSTDHIRGMGECAWHTDGMADFAGQALAMRLNDWAHFAPWSWVNFWPNFLEGMDHQRHPWKFNNHADRKDGVDGWGSPIVATVQRALDPYLVVDRAFVAAGPASGGSTSAPKTRPGAVPRYRAGATLARQIELFNGGLSGREFELRWEVRWDTPTGEVLREGRVGAIEIEPGFHAMRTVEIALPPALETKRTLCLALESVKEGKVVFREDRIRFLILPPGEALASARFIGRDEKTQGDWQGKYGAAGYDLPAVGTWMPAGVNVAWTEGRVWTWAAQTDDARALMAKQPATPPRRVAACRYGAPLQVDVQGGEKARRLSLYYVDWDHQRRKQTFSIWGDDGTLLDRREVGKAPAGCYLTWEIRGGVQISVEHEGGPNAVVSGLFLDELP